MSESNIGNTSGQCDIPATNGMDFLLTEIGDLGEKELTEQDIAKVASRWIEEKDPEEGIEEMQRAFLLSCSRAKLLSLLANRDTPDWSADDHEHLLVELLLQSSRDSITPDDIAQCADVTNRGVAVMYEDLLQRVQNANQKNKPLCGDDIENMRGDIIEETKARIKLVQRKGHERCQNYRDIHALVMKDEHPFDLLVLDRCLVFLDKSDTLSPMMVGGFLNAFRGITGEQQYADWQGKTKRALGAFKSRCEQRQVIFSRRAFHEDSAADQLFLNFCENCAALLLQAEMRFSPVNKKRIFGIVAYINAGLKAQSQSREIRPHDLAQLLVNIFEPVVKEASTKSPMETTSALINSLKYTYLQ